MRRVLLLLLAALLPAFATAALPSFQERSPFTQGLWWDPSRPGSGFDVFNANGGAMVIWYTYDAAGKPVWYTAQGTTDTLGTDWPLLKFKWNGTSATSTQVGTLRFAPDTAESAKLTWNVAGSSATVAIVPFIQSGMVNETDLTGTWFDPARPGWGLSMLDQGEVMGAAIYLYTPAGDPTWVAGFNRSTTIDLYASTGSCPACDYRAPTSQKVGTLGFTYQGDTKMTLQPQVNFAMASGLAIDNAKVVQLGRPASVRGADRGLAQFDAASLKAFMANGMRNVPPYYGAIDFSPAPAGTPGAVTFSTTNLQEAGVDEAGLLKTDGARAYTFAHDAYGNRQAAIRVIDIGMEGSSAAPAGTVSLSGDAISMGNAGLITYDGKLVAIHGSQVYASFLPVPYASGAQWTNGRVYVEVLDTAGSGLPTARWKVDFDGYIVSTRRIGKMLYVVSRFTPSLPGFVFGATAPAAMQANEAALAAADLDKLLPAARYASGAVGPLVGPAQVYAPPFGTRKITAELTTVTAIDLDRVEIAATLAIAGSIETLYASPDYLVLASSRWDTHAPTTGTYLPEPPFARTDVHMVRLAATGMSVAGSGSVEGSISGAGGDKAPFRLSESGGRLRIVTSSSSSQWGPTDANRLTILEPSSTTPGMLKTLSWLPNAQRPATLGKPHELLYGTRFVGDRLYAVTFKKIDPLYVVDLANPSDPKIAGSLEMPGFSDYLHPLPNGLLLGFGKDALPASVSGDFGQFAWYQGLQVALYDVSDAAKPVEKQRLVIGKRGSNSALLDHHHAFSQLQLAPGRLAFAIPASVADGAAVGSSWLGDPNSTTYAWQYSGLLRFELQGTTAADTKIVPQSTLVTASAQGTPTPSGYAPYPDPGSRGGRSVLFTKGIVYGGYGRFWHMDTAGTVTGPF